MSRALALLALLAACSDYRVYTPDDPVPLDPPADELDIWGEPPSNFNDCYNGFLGLYYNLPIDHPHVESIEGDELGALDELDYWASSYSAFSRFDASLDWGENWWPVDNGLVDDPRYFTVRWVGWMRVFTRGTFTFVFGGTQDAWLIVDGEVVAEVRDADELEVQAVPVELTAGIKRIDIRYAHRRGAYDGFRFRLDDEAAAICYPDYQDD